VELLPTPENQPWLIAVLADLVRRGGPGPLRDGAILRARPEDFPDPWSPDEVGVERLLRRLLAHAGLVETGLVVEVEDDAPRLSALGWGGLGPEHHEGAAGWFAGRDGRGRLHFGVRRGNFDDHVRTVAVLGHEVAHAWRHVRGVEVGDRDLEERMTDVTTVYLGFGLFNTNAAMRHVSKGDGLAHGWTASRTGYLSVQDFAWLLAAQALVRRSGWWTRFRLGRELTPNQRACFRRAHDVLAQRADEVRAEVLRG